MTLINSAANENIKRWRKISEHPRGAKKIGTTLAEGIHLAEVICEKRPETRAVVVRENNVHPDVHALAERVAEETGAKFLTVADKLYDAVMAVKPADAVFVFTSGDYRGLRYLQAKHPDVDLLLITSKPCNDETIDLCKAMGIKRMGATMDGTSRKAVKKAHKEGLTVILWPGQSVEDFMLGAYLGCDLMCTDVPIRVKNWLAENAPYIKVKY